MNKNTAAYLAIRMKEASSWAGTVGIVLAAMHVNANPSLVNAGLGVVAAIGGLVAILIPEESNKGKNP